MYGAAEFLDLPCAIVLRDDDRSARGESHKEIDQKVDEDCGRTTHGSQRLCPHKITYNDGIYGVI